MSSIHRSTYLVAYDISSPRRLHQLHRKVKDYAISGQRSFYECLLSKKELQQLIEATISIIDTSEDKVQFFELDPRQAPLYHGKAKKTNTEPFLIV